MSSAEPSPQQSPLAPDLVLSCSVCQESLSSIYAREDEAHALRTSINARNERVTKFWLTDCAHLVCGKHFEGGGEFVKDLSQLCGRFNIELPRSTLPLCAASSSSRLSNMHRRKERSFAEVPVFRPWHLARRI